MHQQRPGARGRERSECADALGSVASGGVAGGAGDDGLDDGRAFVEDSDDPHGPGAVLGSPPEDEDEFTLAAAGILDLGQGRERLWTPPWMQAFL